MLDMRSQNLVRETEQAPDVVAEAELLWHAQCINSIPDTDTSAEKKVSGAQDGVVKCMLSHLIVNALPSALPARTRPHAFGLVNGSKILLQYASSDQGCE